MRQLGADLGALAISHLEEVTDEGIAAMEKSRTAAVLLPTTAYILRYCHTHRHTLFMSVVCNDACVCLGSLSPEPGTCWKLELLLHSAATSTPTRTAAPWSVSFFFALHFAFRLSFLSPFLCFSVHHLFFVYIYHQFVFLSTFLPSFSLFLSSFPSIFLISSVHPSSSILSFYPVLFTFTFLLFVFISSLLSLLSFISF